MDNIIKRTILAEKMGICPSAIHRKIHKIGGNFINATDDIKIEKILRKLYEAETGFKIPNPYLD